MLALKIKNLGRYFTNAELDKFVMDVGSAAVAEAKAAIINLSEAGQTTQPKVPPWK